jgi:hypothetical protein
MANYSGFRIGTPSPKKGVGYFDHFPKNFLKPYGATDKALDDATIFKRLIPGNCEYLKRPKIGLSELAETVKETIHMLENMNNPILKSKCLNELKQAFSVIMSSLEPLDTKANAFPREKEVKKAVRCLIEPNEELDSILDSAYITATNLATLSIQVQVARTLFQNPAQYARLVQASDDSDKEFKIHQDFKTMKGFLVNTCLGGKVAPSKPEASAKRSILELYDSSEDESTKEPPKKKKHLAVADTDSSDEELQNISMHKEKKQFVPRYEGEKGKGVSKTIKGKKPTFPPLEFSVGETSQTNTIDTDTSRKRKEKSPQVLTTIETEKSTDQEIIPEIKEKKKKHKKNKSKKVEN